MFTIATSIFDVYCLAMAAPGSKHYGYFLISYEFVYVGNKHGTRLAVGKRMQLLKTIWFFPTNSTQRADYLCPVLAACRFGHLLHQRVVGHCAAQGTIYNLSWRFAYNYFCLQEYEHKIVPWLWSFAVFTIIRLLAFLFFSIVNDLIFAYNWMMVVIWTIMLLGCAYSWLVIYSLYLELSDLTKLEDLAHLRVSWRLWNWSAHWIRVLTFIYLFYIDGYNGLHSRICKPVDRRVSSDNAIHHCVDNSLAFKNITRIQCNVSVRVSGSHMFTTFHKLHIQCIAYQRNTNSYNNTISALLLRTTCFTKY